MYLFSEIEETFDKAVKQYNSLLSISRDEIKEFGEPKENTIKAFNALLFQMQKAAECINNGLNGKFPWES